MDFIPGTGWYTLYIATTSTKKVKLIMEMNKVVARPRHAACILWALKFVLKEENNVFVHE